MNPLKTYKVGRPYKFETVDDLNKRINQYFKSCFEEYWYDEEIRDTSGNLVKTPRGRIKTVPVRKIRQIKPLTLTGLCIFIGTNRQTISNYKERPEFVDSIREALRFIESNMEQGMAEGKINATAGIFLMKNNFGWKDKTEIDNTIKVEEVKSINYIPPAQIADAKIIAGEIIEPKAMAPIDEPKENVPLPSLDPDVKITTSVPLAESQNGNQSEAHA